MNIKENFSEVYLINEVLIFVETLRGFFGGSEVLLGHFCHIDDLQKEMFFYNHKECKCVLVSVVLFLCFRSPRPFLKL